MTAANPCTQQICGDHICASGEYLKMQQALAQAQIQSSIQNTTSMPNTSMQNITSMQNTTSGVSENQQAVPEFGPITSLVLVIAIISVVAVSVKTRVFLKL